MIRAPAALAIAVVLSAPQTSTAELCAPRAELGGDAVAVERVGDELRRLGVTIAPAGTTTGCPSVKAVVELDRGGGIAVAVRGAAQRSEGRVVSDPTVAAAWIDSWLRDDLEVASWVTAAPVGHPVDQAPVITPRDVPVTPVAAGPSVLERFGISAIYEQAWSSDGSSWSGGSVAGCVLVGGVCVGGRVRAAFEPRLATSATAAERSDLSALATVSLPVDAGQMRIVPELGLGVGRFTTKRIDGCKVTEVMPPPNCDPSDPMCVMTLPVTDCEAGGDPTVVYVGDGLDESSYTPRLAAAVRITVPLFRHVWLDGLASFTLAPFGHRAAYDAPPQPNMIEPGIVAIPGEPASSYQLGIGLRIGAP